MPKNKTAASEDQTPPTTNEGEQNAAPAAPPTPDPVEPYRKALEKLVAACPADLSTGFVNPKAYAKYVEARAEAASLVPNVA